MSEAGEPNAGAPAAAPAAAGRPLNLSILLLVVIALNALGLARGLATRQEILRDIPRFTPFLFALWTAAQAAFVAGAFGTWLLYRWGLYLLAAAWAVAAFVDVRLGATGHAILVTGLFGLVVLFVRPVRATLK